MIFPEKVQQAKNLLVESLARYKRIAVGCSFGKDSMVVLHLARSIKPDVSVFFVTTPFKPKETVDFAEEVRELWNLKLTYYHANVFVKKINPDIWRDDPDGCCRLFKVEPTMDALEHLDAWVTGLRRTEGNTRTDFESIEPYLHLVKINPILDWTETDIWKYTAIYRVPINPLYEQGYRSIGCQPCTSIVDDSETERAGRWKGTAKCGGECGIHTIHKN